MKKRIGVLTKNQRLYNRIRLLLFRDYEVIMLSEYREGLSLVLTDADTCDVPSEKSVIMSRETGADIALPLCHEELLTFISGLETHNEPIRLSPEERTAYLDGEAIKLTDLEYRLLGALIEADGYVSREALLSEIWGEGFDAGVVNVYIHYLRHKLEKNGRKIILSSRKLGYGIDEKYRGGNERC